MAHFLLIHGSCHGAWCWRDVIPALAALGHTAEAIDLPGAGNDPTPLAEVTLDAYGARVAKALRAAPGPVHLVGHSAGGFAISAAAEMVSERIARLIFLCAYAPRDGDTLAEMRRRAARQPLVPALRRTDDGLAFTVDPALAPGIFYHDCPLEAVAFALPRLRPQPRAPQEAPIRLTARSAGLPRSYILCTEDGTIPPEEQERMTADWPPADVIRLASGHSPFLSQPARLAEILAGLAHPGEGG
jgi:pimeloyl-ACP methyl ester carboxylesterase